MQRKHFNQLLIVISSLSLAGCVPATYTVVPEVRGEVVTETGEPAAGAKVTISRADGSPKFRNVVVTADTRGQFHRKEQTQWTMVAPLPLDAIAPEFVAKASLASLHSTPKRFGGGITNPHHFGVTNTSESFDLGNLVLHQPSGGP